MVMCMDALVAELSSGGGDASALLALARSSSSRTELTEMWGSGHALRVQGYGECAWSTIQLYWPPN